MIKNWIVSIVGIIICTTIFQVLMPKGKTKQLVKIIFSLILLMYLIKPIVYLSSYDNIKSLIGTGEYLEIDEGYLEYLKKEDEQFYLKYINGILENAGIEGAKIEVEQEQNKMSFSIKKIKINLSNSVIKKELEHINITEFVKTTLENKLAFNKDNIEVIT